MWGVLVLGALALLAISQVVAAPNGSGPRAPCGVAPVPAFPARDAAPEVEYWTSSALGGNWTPPACTGWDRGGDALVVALAGRFTSVRDADSMLERIGGISHLNTVRYWSVTDRAWEPLFLQASALAAPDPKTTRGDFSPAEIRSGKPLYFLSSDNRSGGSTITQLTFKTIEPDRIVAEMTNVTPLRWLLFDVAPAGGIRTLYFLERQSDGSWQFYSLLRASDARPLLSSLVSPKSYINRAAALYRHMADIQTDRDPPAAP